MSNKDGKMSHMESVRLEINEHMASAGEEILCVLEKQCGVDVCRVKLFVLERHSVAAELIYKLFQREMETLEPLLDKQNKLMDPTLQPHIKHSADFPQLPACQEEVTPEEERSSSLVQEEPEHYIIEEQEEILQTPEEADRLALAMMTILPEKSGDDDGENRGTEPVAGASTENMDRQADVEGCGPAKPTGDDQLLLAPLSDSDFTEDGERKPSVDQSHVEGQRKSLRNKQDLKSSIETHSMQCQPGKKGFSCTVRRKMVKQEAEKKVCQSLAYLAPGNRSGKVLIHDGYRYIKNNSRGGKIYWRCWRKGCSAYLHTHVFDADTEGVSIPVLDVSEHHHTDDMDLIKSDEIKHKMVKAIEADPSRPLEKVYDEVVRGAECNAKMPDAKALPDEVTPGEERSSSLAQEEPEPPHIIEEQEEILQTPEEADRLALASLSAQVDRLAMMTILAEKSGEDDAENRDTEPVASTSTAHMEGQRKSLIKKLSRYLKSSNKIHSNLKSSKKIHSRRRQPGKKGFSRTVRRKSKMSVVKQDVEKKPASQSLAYLAPGNRSGKVLIHDGYRYIKNRTGGEKIYWRCWRKGCGAFVHTQVFDVDAEDVSIPVLDVSEHKHPDDTGMIKSDEIKLRMVKAIEADPSRPPKRVYNEVVQGADFNDEVPKFKAVRSMLSRARAEARHSLAYLAPGNRSGKVLIHDGYRYLKNNTRGGKIYWRCWRKGCSAYLHTHVFDADGEDVSIRVLDVSDHRHADDMDMIKSDEIKQRMVRAIEADPSRSIKRVYDEVVQGAEFRDEVPEFKTVRSMLCRARAGAR